MPTENTPTHDVGTVTWRPKHRWVRVAALLALGAFSATGQAPLSWIWASLLGFAAVFFFLVQSNGWRQAAWTGWLFGLGYFACALSWIVEPFLVDVARHGWMAPFALVGLAGGLSLFWAGAFGGAAAMAQGHSRVQVWLLAILLSLAEGLRGVLFTGFPWAQIGHVWIGWPQMQLAALGGPLALTVLLLGVSAFPAALGAHRAVLGAFIAGALLALPTLYGQFRLTAAVSETDVTVRLVQPNAAQHLKWQPDMIPVFLKRSLDLTAAPPGEGMSRPDLVIWPETSVPYLVRHSGPTFAQMAVAAGGVPVIAGVQRIEAQNRWFNSLVVLDTTGQISTLYDKHHLVPFGEYMPLADTFARLGIFGLAANLTGGYVSGPGPQLIDLGPAGRALPLICYEAIFPQNVSDAPERPDWLLHITNDAWFGQISGPYQHLAQARLRAVEQGLPVLRAANTGVSAAIDPLGRVVADLPLGEAGALDLRLMAPFPETPYSRFGNIPVLAGLFIAMGLLILRGRRHSLDRVDEQS